MSRVKKHFIAVVVALVQIVAFVVVLLPSAFIFAKASSLLNTESFDSGESPGRSFYVAVATQRTGQPFELVRFVEAAHSEAALILPQDDLVARTAESVTIEYHLIEKTPETATIETVVVGEYAITSRYRVEGRRIVPLRHQVFGPGDGMIGFLLALVFCSLLFHVLRRMFKSAASPKSKLSQA